MIRPRFSPRTLCACALLSLLAGTTVLPAAAFKKGETVWSKRHETPLLSEPKPLAKAAAKVDFAEKLKIREVNGAWLRVEADKAKGWVFQGNVAADKPKLPPTKGLTALDASKTNTVAAARPLTPAAEAFAERHDSADAKKDLDWLDETAARVGPAAVVDYMKKNRKGEFQE